MKILIYEVNKALVLLDLDKRFEIFPNENKDTFTFAYIVNNRGYEIIPEVREMIIGLFVGSSKTLDDWYKELGWFQTKEKYS